MSEFSETLVIDHPALAVWAALADFDSIAIWAPNVDHSCLLAVQSQGVGTARRIQTGRNVLVERVVEWEPGRRLGYVIQGLPPVIGSVTNTWSLYEHDRSTTVTLTTTIDASFRPPQKVAARAVGRLLAKASRQMLQGLDDHLRQPRKVGL